MIPAVTRDSIVLLFENALAVVPSCALTTVRVFPLIAVTLTISLFVSSSMVQRKYSPALKLGNTDPSKTDTEVADEVMLDARTVFALFLKTTATASSYLVKKPLQSK
jgi:hypothetical protein